MKIILNSIISLIFIITYSRAAQQDFWRSANIHAIKTFFRENIDQEVYNRFDSKGGVPLMRICENTNLNDNERLEVANLLINNGSNINERHKNTNKTSIHVAASNNKYNLVEFFLNKDINGINARDNQGCTPLVHASSFSDTTRSLDVLLRYGADIDAPDNSDGVTFTGGGMTALHWAAQEGCVENVRTLLSKGANPNLKTKKEKTVLDCLKYGRSSGVSLENYKAIEKLLESSQEEVGALAVSVSENLRFDFVLNNEVEKIKEILPVLSNSDFLEYLNFTINQDEINILCLFKDGVSTRNIKNEVKKYLNPEK